jgi:hypothetical protein
LGPAQIRVDVVARHARELGGELAERRAGSQQEQAAAIYVLGHVQRAGYNVRLDGVPVSDLVRSTNVVALPPGGDDPDVVVAVAYDTPEGAPDEGEAVGLWLELARALRSAEPRHSVEFAALGAEHAEVRGGGLGSRRLAQVLLEEGTRPAVITIEWISPGRTDGLAARGPDAADLLAIARRLGIRRSDRTVAGSGADAFETAGLDHLRVGGGAEEVGRALLEYLSSGAQ